MCIAPGIGALLVLVGLADVEHDGARAARRSSSACGGVDLADLALGLGEELAERSAWQGKALPIGSGLLDSPQEQPGRISLIEPAEHGVGEVVHVGRARR